MLCFLKHASSSAMPDLHNLLPAVPVELSWHLVIFLLAHPFDNAMMIEPQYRQAQPYIQVYVHHEIGIRWSWI